MPPTKHNPDDDFAGPDDDILDRAIEVDLDRKRPGGKEDGDRDADAEDGDGKKRAAGEREERLGGRRPRASDDEDDDLPDRIQKRLRKERWRRGELERELAIERSKRKSVEERLGQADRYVIDNSVKSLEEKRLALRKQIAAARESGDTELSVELEDELADVRDRLRYAQGAKQRTEQQRGREEEGEGRGRQEQDGKPATKLRQITKDFLDEVGFDKWGKADKALLSGLDVEVAEEGFDPEDAEYYVELEKRMSERAPHLFEKGGKGKARDDDAGDDGDEEERPQRRDPPRRRNGTGAGSGGRERGGDRPGGSTVRITADEKTMMRTLKLDPGNPEHIREFAANKRMRLRDERGQDEEEE